MRTLIQRVAEASVTVNGEKVSGIGKGLLIFAGVEENDTDEDAVWLAHKAAALRIFPDLEGVMNLDIRQAAGEILVVSQFTLHARIKKGNRPSYLCAAGPEKAVPILEQYNRSLHGETGIDIQEGLFGADMKVSLVNDGPVTIWMDSRNKE